MVIYPLKRCGSSLPSALTAIAYPATVTAFGGLTLQRHPTRDQLLPEGNAVPVCTLVPTHGRIERCLPSWRPAPVPAGVGTVCLKHVGPARVSTRSIVMRRVGGLLASHRTVLPAITWCSPSQDTYKEGCDEASPWEAWHPSAHGPLTPPSAVSRAQFQGALAADTWYFVSQLFARSQVRDSS